MQQLPENFLAILDVGHGNAAVLRCNDDIVIIDTGKGTNLLEFLEVYGLCRIKYVFISHADKDHIGGLLAVLTQKHINVDNIYLNSDALKESDAWRDLVYQLQELKRAGEVDFTSCLREGDVFSAGTSSILVLSPSSALAATGPGATTPAGRKVTSNTISAVLKVVVPGISVLFTGDIDSVGLEESWGATDFSANILVYPHHGGQSGVSDEMFAQDLMSRAKPSFVVFSVGRNTHRNPRPEVVRAIRNCSEDIQIFCTQLSKNCEESYPSVGFPSEINSEHRCAGSVVLDLDSASIVSPDQIGFPAFIAGNVSTPMCCDNTNNQGKGSE